MIFWKFGGLKRNTGAHIWRVFRAPYHGLQTPRHEDLSGPAELPPRGRRPREPPLGPEETPGQPVRVEGAPGGQERRLEDFPACVGRAGAEAGLCAVSLLHGVVYVQGVRFGDFVSHEPRYPLLGPAPHSGSGHQQQQSRQ